jgi:hypothetical protein
MDDGRPVQSVDPSARGDSGKRSPEVGGNGVKNDESFPSRDMPRSHPSLTPFYGARSGNIPATGHRIFVDKLMLYLIKQ